MIRSIITKSTQENPKNKYKKVNYLKTKLKDLKALESVTIAAYGIPEDLQLESKAKYTRASGKRNCFFTNTPGFALEKDLEVLSGKSHRLSCTFSFSMTQAGFDDLTKTLESSPNFTSNEKKNKPNHHIIYVNMRKFTISYFVKKQVAAIYVNFDLFDNYLSGFFMQYWGEKAEMELDTVSEKKAELGSHSYKVPEESPRFPKKNRTLELTTLSSEKSELWKVPVDFNFHKINFRINRVVVEGYRLNKTVLTRIQRIVEKSSNSVSMKTESDDDNKQKVILVSNVNSYLLEAMKLIEAESSRLMHLEIRLPIKTGVWKYLTKTNWMDKVKQQATGGGFCLIDDDDAILFERNGESGICEIKGNLSQTMADVLEQLDDIIDNNLGKRNEEIGEVNESIRKKIPHTVKILKDKAELFVSLISPSFVLLNDSEIELTDYSPMVFSVYRGVELYLKYLADLSGIDLSGKSVGKMFKDAGNEKKYLRTMNDTLQRSLLDEVFKNFSDYRNSLFHANLDEVVIISSRKDAEDICINALQTLESASFQFQLEEMTMTL